MSCERLHNVTSFSGQWGLSPHARLVMVKKSLFIGKRKRDLLERDEVICSALELHNNISDQDDVEIKSKHVHLYQVLDLKDCADIPHDKLLRLFDHLVTYVKDHISCNSSLNIVMNCHHGRNRSVTFLLYLLFELYQMSPVDSFHLLQDSYEKKFGNIPKFLVSKTIGLQGVTFLDWCIALRNTSSTNNNHRQRKSARFLPPSPLAIAVASGKGDVKNDYLCRVLQQGQVSFFISDMKGARRVLSNPEDELGNSFSVVSANISGIDFLSGSSKRVVKNDKYELTVIGADIGKGDGTV